MQKIHNLFYIILTNSKQNNMGNIFISADTQVCSYSILTPIDVYVLPDRFAILFEG